MTKKEYEDQMNQWADKYGVRVNLYLSWFRDNCLINIKLQVKYDAFKKEMEDDKNRSEQELDEALKALPNFFNELRMIENNDVWYSLLLKKNSTDSTAETKSVVELYIFVTNNFNLENP